MDSNAERERRRLTRAYEATSYRATCPEGEVVLRIGRCCELLDRLLARAGSACWAFVSAANPGSIQLAPEENARRHAHLLAVLEEGGMAVFPGTGEPDHPGWPAEPSVLVLGIDRSAAMALGRRFGQNAIVFGRIGEPASLVWC